MDVRVYNSRLSGHLSVPASKSHTIRALLLAAMAHGTSHIYNPLDSEDCRSTFKAIALMGAKASIQEGKLEGKAAPIAWVVQGAGDALHLPDNVVDVGNSGSLLYFMSPIAATFSGYSVFTGDFSIRKRPIGHVLELLRAMGAKAQGLTSENTTPPLLIKGPIQPCSVTAEGALSQYISGAMMGATRLKGVTTIELTSPKETPYLDMTREWLISLGANVSLEKDYSKVTISGPCKIPCFDRTIPSDWEAVAFPLIASLMTGSTLTIDNIDSSGTQGDAAIVDILQRVGAPIVWDKEHSTLTIEATSATRLTTRNIPGGTLRVALSSFPDAICALAAIACFIEGKTILEDLSVCRKKECDRVAVLARELSRAGANIREVGDSLHIVGSSESAHILKGINFHSYSDHRVAMAQACLALAIKDSTPCTIDEAQCASISFPNFYECLRSVGARIEGL